MFCLNNRPFIPKKVLLDNFFNLFVGVDIYILWAINKRSDSRNIKIHLFIRDVSVLQKYVKNQTKALKCR